MNEIKLSNDLNVITAEIKTWKSFAGMSVWEIGKRIKHVKENDLTHGNYINWLSDIGIDRSEAYRYIKIADELPNDDTWQHLSTRAMYLITTLPEEQKQEQIEKVNEGHKPTVKEIEDLKRKNREQEKTIEEQQKIINEQANKKPEIVEVEVPKEVVPHDYDGLKSDNQQLEFSNRRLRKQMQEMEERQSELLEQQKGMDEKSKKYDELNEAIQEMQGKMDEGQKSIKAQKDVYDLVRKANELIVEVAPLTYLIDTENIIDNEYARKPIEKIISNLRDMADRLDTSINQQIYEGEIINE